MIFVSHRENDRSLAEALVEFLLESLRIRRDYIRCTSLPGHQLSFSHPIAQQLRRDLLDSRVVFALLTRSSLQSTWVHRELGAAWVLEHMVVHILAPNVGIADLPADAREYPCILAGASDAAARLLDAVKDTAARLKLDMKQGRAREGKLNAFVEMLRKWPDSLPSAHEYGQAVTFSSFPPAKSLSTPRDTASLETALPTRQFRLGPLYFPKVAIVLRPVSGVPWHPDDILWHAHPQSFNLHPIWAEIEKSDPLPDFEASDQLPGKHVRLAAAGLGRSADSPNLALVWQPISWADDRRTNIRIARQVCFHGHRIDTWFREEDLVPPPLESNEHVFDPPLANRLAINMAVILNDPNEGPLALFQHRTHDLVVHADRIEAGASESVHGFTGWSEAEQDFLDGHPDLRATISRCMWQELGVSDCGTVSTHRGFGYTAYFTALVLNKIEFSPRLVGVVEIEGTREELLTAAQSTMLPEASHRRFGPRTVKDAVPVGRLHFAPATPEGLAWFFKDNRFSPECRPRLALYLEHAAARSHSVDAVFSALPRPVWPGWCSADQNGDSG